VTHFRGASRVSDFERSVSDSASYIGPKSPVSKVKAFTFR
jgi:hypothetical protein